MTPWQGFLVESVSLNLLHYVPTSRPVPLDRSLSFIHCSVGMIYSGASQSDFSVVSLLTSPDLNTSTLQRLNTINNSLCLDVWYLSRGYLYGGLAVVLAEHSIWSHLVRGVVRGWLGAVRATPGI